jgi:hypothetical protein
MKYRTRTYYTDGQKALMWERWQEGWTLHQIAHLFNRAHTSVRGVLAQTGGIRPPQRSRSAIALTPAEREEISRAVAEGQSIRSITMLSSTPARANTSNSRDPLAPRDKNRRVPGAPQPSARNAACYLRAVNESRTDESPPTGYNKGAA